MNTSHAVETLLPKDVDPRVAPAGCGSQPLTAEQQPAQVTDAERTEQKPFRMWAVECPFRKDGTPVLGSFGRSSVNVVIMTTQTWTRLCQAIPQLQTTQFEVGTYE